MTLPNMPESRCESLKDGRRKATFMKTPKMSTYVLAYCIVGTDEVGAAAECGTKQKRLWWLCRA